MPSGVVFFRSEAANFRDTVDSEPRNQQCLMVPSRQFDVVLPKLLQNFPRTLLQKPISLHVHGMFCPWPR
jgi:hypothetical protein